MKEGRQEDSFWIYQVRQPRGAFKEEDRQERSSSACYHVRHPRGAFYERRSSRRLLLDLSS